jgi:hypothetical protein
MPLENSFFFLPDFPVFQKYLYIEKVAYVCALPSCMYVCMYCMHSVKFEKQTFVHVEDNVFVPLHFPFKVSNAQRRNHIMKVNHVVVVPYLYLHLYHKTQFRTDNVRSEGKEG